MTSIVFDASAVLTLVRDEPGAEEVAAYIGHAAISAVNLQEVIKELLLSGLDEPIIRELLSELRLDVRGHDVEAAFIAAGLHEQTEGSGYGLGDRSCMALALQLGTPVLTADGTWRKVKIKGLKFQYIG